MEFNFGIGTTIQEIFCNFVEKEWWYVYNNSHMAAQVRECKHLLRKSIQHLRKSESTSREIMGLC